VACSGGAGQTALDRMTKRSTSLRVLILYANPVTASFGATLHNKVVRTLRSRGHVKRLVRWMPGHDVRCDYLAYYDMDHSSSEQRGAFLKKVRQTFEGW
jgi:putative NADPH-quinone reductase